MEHIFHLVSGALNMPGTDRSQSMYDYIIVLDEADDASNDIPIEALFDDLAVSGLVFPLNKYTRGKWTAQHPIVQHKLFVADLRDMAIDGNRTTVVIRAWGGKGVKFYQGRSYRLSPRLVDFNTSKILAVLLEMDLRCISQVGDEDDLAVAMHHDLPLLQMILDPGSFGRSPMADKYLTTENVIQKLFRDLKDLGVEAATSLVLKSSQHRAAQRILSNRLSVIWGPPGKSLTAQTCTPWTNGSLFPGTGKTYTIALSLLRLLDVQHRHGDSARKIIFITAMTHAAIDACRKKLVHLISCYRAIDSLSTAWLDRVKVEQVLKGSEHPAPSSSGLFDYIYTGTTYQVRHPSSPHP